MCTYSQLKKGGNMKLTTLYMRAVTNAYLCNDCIFLYFFKNILGWDFVKTKPLRYCIELLV